MKKHELKLRNGPLMPQSIEIDAAARLTRIEDALDEGLEESFPASDPVAIDTRSAEKINGMKAGRRAMRAVEISCIVEYAGFTIELNAEQRKLAWFPEFQISKGGQIIVPWRAPAVPPSPTKKIAIEAGVGQAFIDIRGGLATAFC